MAENPKITITSEITRMVQDTATDIGDVLRHEGLKKAAERLLYLGGASSIGRKALEHLARRDYDQSRLATNLGGLALDGPVGIGAGWDKTGKTIRGWQAAGANHITLGGVPLDAQPGNPMVRLRTFDERVGDHGKRISLNAFGFSSAGAVALRDSIENQREDDRVQIPVIIQVTANKDAYLPENRHSIPNKLAETIKIVESAADGIELGITSPNTLGMRDSQTREFVRANMAAAREAAGDLPLGWKGDGDGGEERLDMYCELLLEMGFDYVALINTTRLERILEKYGAEKFPGGLAGADEEYMQLAVDAVRHVYEAIGDKVDIMALGGAGVPEQAIRLARAGGSAIGVNSGIRIHGLKTIPKVEGAIEYSIPSAQVYEDIVGADTSRGPKSKQKKVSK